MRFRQEKRCLFSLNGFQNRSCVISVRQSLLSISFTNLIKTNLEIQKLSVTYLFFSCKIFSPNSQITSLRDSEDLKGQIHPPLEINSGILIMYCNTKLISFHASKHFLSYLKTNQINKSFLVIGKMFSTINKFPTETMEVKEKRYRSKIVAALSDVVYLA